jgi:hypothetical protein
VALAQTAAQLVGAGTTEEILAGIARHAVADTRALACGITVVDGDHKVTSTGGYGLPAASIEAMAALRSPVASGSLTLGDVLVGGVILTDKFVVLPDAVLAVIGILFTAAGTRSIFSSHMPRRHVPRQLGLIALLLLTFAFELASGIALILNPYSGGAAGLVTNLLVALLIIGIARTWELVGDRDTGLIASIAVLAGHDRNPGPSAGSGPRSGSDPTSVRPRTADARRGRRRPPGVSSTSPARRSSRRRPSKTAKHNGDDAVRRTGRDPRSLPEVPHRQPVGVPGWPRAAS